MPMLAASIDGQIIFVVIAAIIGVINWLMKKGEAGKTDTSPSPKFPRPTAPGADPEGERMRKFLEALGVPADQAPKPIRRPPPAHTQPAPPPLPRRRPQSLDEEPAPTRHVEALHFPELRTPEVPTFQTRPAAVSAIPAERHATAERDAYLTAPTERPEDELRALLRSPRDLRAAFLVREVLGPPRGLQTGFSAHTFAAS